MTPTPVCSTHLCGCPKPRARVLAQPQALQPDGKSPFHWLVLCTFPQGVGRVRAALMDGAVKCGKSISSAAVMLGLKSQLCLLLALCSWVGYLTFLCLSFLIRKMGIIMASSSQGFCKVELLCIKCLGHWLEYSGCHIRERAIIIKEE